MSRPESPTRPERRIRIGARFTPTFSIIFPKHFFMLFHFRLFNYAKALLFGQSHNHLQTQKTHNIHNQFMRFKHIHNNPITLVNIGYSIHNFWRIPFDKSHPYYHSVMCLYIYNSISHHDGCRLVHPDTWYYLFGSPIMTDAV